MADAGNSTIVATVIGGAIAGTAMIINSIVSTWLSNKKENLHLKQQQFEKDIVEISQLYEKAIFALKKLIDDYGRATDKEWKDFSALEIKLKLYSDKKIVENFIGTKNTIVEYAHKLPDLPEEFIPKFEQDDDRRFRLEERKKAKEERKKIAHTLLPDVNKVFSDFSGILKADLILKKELKDL